MAAPEINRNAPVLRNKDANIGIRGVTYKSPPYGTWARGNDPALFRRTATRAQEKRAHQDNCAFTVGFFCSRWRGLATVTVLPATEQVDGGTKWNTAFWPTFWSAEFRIPIQ